MKRSPTGILFPLLFLLALLPACQPGSPDAGEAGGDAPPVFPATGRPDVIGLQMAVSSDHPLATEAGMEVLRRGGNATDAAVTMAAVLAVVRPHMNGVGGDAFGIFLNGATGEVQAMNASGRAGALATPDFFLAAGDTAVPYRGPRSVSVPGAVGGWAEALARHGTITLAQAVAPAIRLAEEGFPISWRMRSDIEGGARPLNDAARAVYLPGGSAPEIGMLLRNPGLAATLRTLAREGARAMYGGSIGARIAAFLEAEGGYLRTEDFAAHTTTWVTPLQTEYLGYRILAMPPSTQGVTLLQQMKMAEALGAELRDAGHNTAAYLHRMVGIKELAFADRDRWVADPDFVPVPVERMLSPEYAAERVGALSAGRALTGVRSGIEEATQSAAARPSDEDGVQGDGDTVYLTVVDAQGNAVSWIQSLYASFGSGLLEPETGIVLQNRGAGFVLDPAHPQVVAPGKRPFHTLTPHMALRGDGRLAFTFGTPGGDSQTQSLLQIVHNMEFFGMTPQEAIEAPRYRSEDGELLVEDRIPASVRRELQGMGYDARPASGWTATFGGAQFIVIHPESGARIVASDPRREAYGLAW
jgi:gamma-glutamyltranspeptidase / glutathione hydrolase